MLVNKHEILDFIPQRPPVVMIDRLIAAEDKKTITGFTVLPDNIFVFNRRFREPGLIENIAQSAAAGIGYYYKKQRNQIPPPGFIGAIKNLNIYLLPEIYSELITEINVEHEVMNASVIRGCIMLQDKTVADCEMKIFLMQPGQ